MNECGGLAEERPTPEGPVLLGHWAQAPELHRGAGETASCPVGITVAWVFAAAISNSSLRGSKEPSCPTSLGGSSATFTLSPTQGCSCLPIGPWGSGSLGVCLGLACSTTASLLAQVEPVPEQDSARVGKRPDQHFSPRVKAARRRSQSSCPA